MNPLYLLVLTIPISFISGASVVMFMSLPIVNESPQIVSSNVDDLSILQNNGSAFVAVNLNTNYVYVSNEVSNTISVIDGNTNTKIASIPVGVNPSGITVNPDTNHIYVANYVDGTVTVIDGNNNTVIDRPIPLDFGLEGITVNPFTNRIYVANAITTTLYVIDGNTASKINEIRNLSSWNVAVNPNTNKIFVPSYFFNNLSVIDGMYDDVMTVIQIGSYPNNI